MSENHFCLRCTSPWNHHNLPFVWGWFTRVQCVSYAQPYQLLLKLRDSLFSCDPTCIELTTVVSMRQACHTLGMLLYLCVVHLHKLMVEIQSRLCVYAFSRTVTLQSLVLPPNLPIVEVSV